MMSKPPIKNQLDELAVKEGCYYDPDAGERVVDFCQSFCVHTTGQWAGQKVKLFDWTIKDFIMPLYSWKRPNGSRRYRKALLFIAKKNGKSKIASCLSLYHMFADGEHGAGVYTVATSKEHADRINFRETARTIRQSQELSQVGCEIIDSTCVIYHRETDSIYQALSRDADASEGLSWSLLHYDELHAASNAKLYASLEAGGRSRWQPLLLITTTAGASRQGVCWDEYEFAKKNQTDWTYFSLIYETPSKDDISNPDNWKKANPSMGAIIDPVDFKADYERAKNYPTKMADFRRYSLNQWSAHATETWIPVHEWASCESDWRPEEGARCYAGLDISSRIDFTCLCLLFPHDDKWFVQPHFWLPEENAKKREKKWMIPISKWVQRRHLNLTEGNAIDLRQVRRTINELASYYRLRCVCLDEWGAQHFITEITEEDGIECVGFNQWAKSFHEPTTLLEAWVLDKHLEHDGNECLSWMLENTAVISNKDGYWKPMKPMKDSPFSVDGIIALIQAIAVSQKLPLTSSVYEEYDPVA